MVSTMTAKTSTAIDTPADLARRRELKKFKIFTTGLLVLAAVIFLAAEWALRAGHTELWIRLVKAGAEAGMVGGLADWFAVTALFRRPMGLPIPHTNLVAQKKDQIGESLTEFVATNFLNTESIVAKVRDAQVAAKVGEWLNEGDHARRVSAEAGELLANVVRRVDDDAAAAALKRIVVDKLAEPEWAPPAGNLLESLHREGYTDPVIDEISQWLHKKALGSQDLIERLLAQRAPEWAPRFVNELVVDFAGDKVYQELTAWTAALAADPNHEARVAVRNFLENFARNLQEDPALIARIEGIKGDVLNSQTLQEAPRKLWAAIASYLISEAEDEQSFLRTRLTALALEWGGRLSHDADLAAKVDGKVIAVAQVLVDRYAGEITSIIGEKIAEWPARDAANKIELLVGKDLQYIRINGTVVGALAGMAIFLISVAIFGA